MAEVSIDITVSCGKCGRELSSSAAISHNRIAVDAAPYEFCMDEAHSDGNTEGWNERNDEVAGLEQQIAELLEQLPPAPLPESATDRPRRLIQH